MQLSSMPALVGVPFAENGTKNIIPVDSQIGIVDGAASYNDGFPPLTMTPVVAGGIPPFGNDFNGILNAVTRSIRWACAGGLYRYDSGFVGVTGGYPKGALIQNIAGDVIWISTADNNTGDPTSGGGWLPAIRYGVTSVTLAGENVTLSPEQAAKETIILSGTLTANIQLIMPAWLISWLIVNNTTGNFTISVKTASGGGVNLVADATSQLYGDGTNIYYGALMARNNLAEINAAGETARQAGRDNLGLGTAATYDYEDFLPSDYQPPAAPVTSVNGETGAVQLNAGDVGAYSKTESDARYMQGIQFGAQSSLSVSNNQSFSTAGYSLTGYNCDGNNDDLDTLYAKPVQKNINGVWTTIPG